MCQLSSKTDIKELQDVLNASQTGSNEQILLIAILIYLRWADFKEAELESIAEVNGTVYKPFLPESLRWRSWHDISPEQLTILLTKNLPAFLRQIDTSIHNSLANHLHCIANTIQQISTLEISKSSVLVKFLAEQPFETKANRLNLLRSFDALLDTYIKHNFETYKTPNHIAKLMVELASPKQGESVYDPCFGTAGLLTAASDYVNQQIALINPADNNTICLSGIELNLSSYIIGMTRLVLAGVESPEIKLGNSLEKIPQKNLQQEGFDIVLANPPFGFTTIINPQLLRYFPIMTKDSTGMFIQHALANLRPGGRAVFVIPESFLFRGGAEQKLRKWLIDEHNVEAVIGLPENVFFPITSTKCNIILLKCGKSTKKIRMMDASSFFEKSKGRRPVVISNKKITELVEQIHSYEYSDHCWDITVASLAQTGFDLTPKRKLNILQKSLETIKSSVELITLKDCCEIINGVAVGLSNLPNRPLETTRVGINKQDKINDTEYIPFVGIKDINNGQINTSSSWTNIEITRRRGGIFKLQLGDILLSKAGNIGKIGIVKEGAEGALASQSLYALRADTTRINPYFLNYYLNSIDCKDWFRENALGSAIGHLPKSIIEKLPIPIIPLDEQQSIVEDYIEHGVDFLEYLRKKLTNSNLDPILEWIYKALKDLPSDTAIMANSLDFTIIDELVKKFILLKKELYNIEFNYTELHEFWFKPFSNAILILKGITNIPKSSGLLSLLQESLDCLRDAEEITKTQLSSESKVNKLIKILSQWLRQSRYELLNTDNVKVSISSDKELLYLNDIADIELKIENKGYLPIRELQMKTTFSWNKTERLDEHSYLGENSYEVIHLTINTHPSTEQTLTLYVNWSALTLDGKEVSGSCEIPFILKSPATISGEQADFIDFEGSPYVCGDPIIPDKKNKNIFFGREELIKQISRQIIKNGNVVLLEGIRRAGKSSILRHLEGTTAIPGWLAVYCSLQGADGEDNKVGISTKSIFCLIASQIAKSLTQLEVEIPLPDGSILPIGKKIGIEKACRNGISESFPFQDFSSYLEIVLDAIKSKNIGILLMLDEFDKVQEGIDSGVTSPQVPENIRFLIHHYPRFSAILTGSRRLKRLREEYWSALFGLGTRFGVTSLSDDAAKKLVTEPVKELLAYSTEAVEEILHITNNQPFLLQSLCNRIFDIAAQDKIRSIKLDIVAKASDKLIDNNEHFKALWSYADSALCRFLLALCHKRPDIPDELRLGAIHELLYKYGINISEEKLIESLESLEELELIKKSDGEQEESKKYAISIPLMGRWIDLEHDFEVLKKQTRNEIYDTRTMEDYDV